MSHRTYSYPVPRTYFEPKQPSGQDSEGESYPWNNYRDVVEKMPQKSSPVVTEIYRRKNKDPEVYAAIPAHPREYNPNEYYYAKYRRRLPYFSERPTSATYYEAEDMPPPMMRSMHPRHPYEVIYQTQPVRSAPQGAVRRSKAERAPTPQHLVKSPRHASPSGDVPFFGVKNPKFYRRAHVLGHRSSSSSSKCVATASQTEADGGGANAAGPAANSGNGTVATKKAEACGDSAKDKSNPEKQEQPVDKTMRLHDHSDLDAMLAHYLPALERSTAVKSEGAKPKRPSKAATRFTATSSATSSPRKKSAAKSAKAEPKDLAKPELLDFDVLTSDVLDKMLRDIAHSGIFGGNMMTFQDVVRPKVERAQSEHSVRSSKARRDGEHMLTNIKSQSSEYVTKIDSSTNTPKELFETIDHVCAAGNQEASNCVSNCGPKDDIDFVKTAESMNISQFTLTEDENGAYGTSERCELHKHKVPECTCGTRNYSGKSSLMESLSTDPRRRTTEDPTVIELHRSKSYIVNLIDRALSRELGMEPSGRRPKHYHKLDVKTALELVNSPMGQKMDSELCIEITHALTESMTQEAALKESQNEAKTDLACGGATDEEPLYLKQLKKLRYGHLKNIKREMKRLEDLERFLDSCYDADSS